MGLRETRFRILEAIERNPYDLSAFTDLFCLCRDMEKENFAAAHKWSHELRSGLSCVIRKAVADKDFRKADKANDLLYRSYLFDSPYFFDDYLQAIEFGKPLSKRFYQPRRCYLKRYVDAYQKILDGEIDFLSVSMPKRSGKTTLGIHFINMISGKYPDKSTLMEGVGEDLVRSFYDGCLEYLKQPSDYHFHDIFPESPLVSTNAKVMKINLVNDSRFPTIMCRSIDSSQVGLSEATNLLYLDDCVAGYAEAKNRDILDEKWRTMSGDILGRAIEGTPIVICGTRYSIYDPIGRLQEEMRKAGKRMLVLETPALDRETDESNFEFELDGRKIFTTKYFREQREMLSAEQFESEFQQQPFEAKGLLFPEKSLNRYFRLPVDIEPDCVIAVCDTADRGADYCSMPVAIVYGDEVYIDDVVFDDSPPEVTKPEVANALSKNAVSECTFESNNAGSYFAKDVQELLTAKGCLCSIRTQRSVSSKQTRIEFASDNILKHFWFKDSSLYARNSQYALFIRNLVTYTRTGKVAHDDAPDSLAMLENILRRRKNGKIEILRRSLF